MRKTVAEIGTPVVVGVFLVCKSSEKPTYLLPPSLPHFSFQPVLHDWCNNDRGMYYPVCGMMHIKEPLLLIGKSSLYGGSGFHLSLPEWSFTICLTPYNRKQNVLNASLNKTFPSFLSPRPTLNQIVTTRPCWTNYSLLQCSNVTVENPQ